MPRPNQDQKERKRTKWRKTERDGGTSHRRRSGKEERRGKERREKRVARGSDGNAPGWNALTTPPVYEQAYLFWTEPGLALRKEWRRKEWLFLTFQSED
ncbi:hypothetical protein K474DRAFT_1658997 [Panus rudis PR-1116 ss-1]|nr:hypothetical protein K474DRAFT_1658997 [Panus rudis PR-1116 ss-1]